MKVLDIYKFLDTHFPFCTACEWDNSGLLIGDGNATVTKVIIALDCTDSVLDMAQKNGAELIITHHPVIFPNTNCVLSDSIVHRLIKNGISVISAHTNLDKAEGGVNDCLAKALSLENIQTVLADEGLTLRLGKLKTALSPDDFAKYVGDRLGVTPRYCVGDRPVKAVAVCGGSCGDLLEDAVSCGADAYVTADIKHHIFLEAAHRGITLVDGGHFNTEDTVIEPLRKLLASHFPQIPFLTNHLSAVL